MLTQQNINLTKNAIDLWVISLPLDDAQNSKLNSYLNPDELIKVQSFKFKYLQDIAIASRGGLRVILSQYLITNPESIDIRTTAFGKPYLYDSNLRFNVSHSGNYVLIAMSYGNNLGIDIEKMHGDFDYKDIASNYFTNNEIAVIESENTQDLYAFYRAWTRKEACLKAVGKGLTIDLKDIEVTCSSNEPAKVLNFVNHNKNWQLFEISINPEYMASVAVQASEPFFINKLDFKSHFFNYCTALYCYSILISPLIEAKVSFLYPSA